MRWPTKYTNWWYSNIIGSQKLAKALSNSTTTTSCYCDCPAFSYNWLCSFLSWCSSRPSHVASRRIHQCRTRPPYHLINKGSKTSSQMGRLPPLLMFCEDTRTRKGYCNIVVITNGHAHVDIHVIVHVGHNPSSTKCWSWSTARWSNKDIQNQQVWKFPIQGPHILWRNIIN